MIPYEKIKIGDWKEFFQSFYDSGGFEKIYEGLKEVGQTANILPKGKDLWKAFEKCPPSKLKTIILGQDPYFMTINGVVVADGLAFSCSNTGIEQPSLRMWYDGLEEDIYDGLNLNMERDTDLTFLAQEGILLLNSAMTVKEGETNSMRELWKPFMTYLLQGTQCEDLPIVFIGAKSKEYRYLCPDSPTKYVEHPAFAAREQRKWRHEKMFSWVDGHLGEKIHWDNSPFLR